jgi:hypothetical protein
MIRPHAHLVNSERKVDSGIPGRIGESSCKSRLRVIRRAVRIDCRGKGMCMPDLCSGLISAKRLLTGLTTKAAGLPCEVSVLSNVIGVIGKGRCSKGSVVSASELRKDAR